MIDQTGSEIDLNTMIDAIRAVDRIIMAEIDQMVECKQESLLHNHRWKRLHELCPEGMAALHRFHEDRRAAGDRIDPLTCEWNWWYADDMDYYGVFEASSLSSVGRSIYVWDEQSDGGIHISDLPEEKQRLLNERIGRGKKERPRTNPTVGTDLAKHIRERR